MRINSLEKFGLVTVTRNYLLLTELALRCVNSNTEKEAITQSLLTFEPFKALCELYNGGHTLDDKTLEKRLIECGVVESRASEGRRVFQKSAQYTNLFSPVHKKTTDNVLNFILVKDEKSASTNVSSHVTDGNETKISHQISGNMETRIITLSDTSMISISLQLKVFDFPLSTRQYLFKALEDIEKLDMRNSYE